MNWSRSGFGRRRYSWLQRRGRRRARGYWPRRAARLSTRTNDRDVTNLLELRGVCDGPDAIAHVIEDGNRVSVRRDSRCVAACTAIVGTDDGTLQEPQLLARAKDVFGLGRHVLQQQGREASKNEDCSGSEKKEAQRGSYTAMGLSAIRAEGRGGLDSPVHSLGASFAPK